MRVLILADSCNPDWPSLPVVGYKASKAIADEVDVVVATHVRNRESIERAGFGRAQVVYIDNEWIAAPMYRLAGLLRGGSSSAWTTNIALSYPSYLAFEAQAWHRFRRELMAGEFDVVHRITPMSPTLPSYMASRCPVPFIVGPLNGGLKWPQAFQEALHKEGEYLTYVRGVYKHLPFYEATYRHAAAVLASFDHTIDGLPQECRPRVIDFPEVGIDPELFARPQARDYEGRITFAFSGRFVPLKCIDVAIEAVAGSELLRQHRLLLIGDGTERAQLERLIALHGLEQCVEITGWCDQSQVGRYLREAHAFIFPSVRELGAGVVVEAMACGLAMGTVRYGAPGTLVDEASGFRVPLGDRDSHILGFRAGMEAFINDRGRMRQAGEAAYETATRLYAWDAKARRTVEVYRWALGRRDTKPAFDG